LWHYKGGITHSKIVKIDNFWYKFSSKEILGVYIKPEYMYIELLDGSYKHLQICNNVALLHKRIQTKRNNIFKEQS